jgi:sulfopyruvate decarboxylase TPP-binding subunit
VTAETPATRAKAIVGQLVAADVSLAAMLPESWLPDLIAAVDAEPAISQIRVTREDDGAAICAGAALAGVRGVLICQNAGLLASANGLAAYANYHQIPFLVIASARGGVDDSFFYQTYKNVTAPVLTAIGMPHHCIDGPADDHLIPEAMQQAWLNRKPVALLCTRRGLLGEEFRA